MKPPEPSRCEGTAALQPWRGPDRRQEIAIALLCSRSFSDLVTMVRAVVALLLRGCGAFEWIALGYLNLLNTLILIFHRNLPHAPVYLALHSAVAALILLLCRSADSSAALRFARYWYPQAFFLFCFEELNWIVHLIFPGWFDRWFIDFDHWLVGVCPTVWLQQYANPLLNDFMQMAYISYFFYLTILAALLYCHGERRAFWSVMTSSVLAYTVGYTIAILLPVESPYHSLAALEQVPLTGGFFTWLINVLEGFGRVHGAAFPSAHVSGSTVALVGAWRYRRCLFWIYLPFFVCMLLATVYGRYHYIADVLGGLPIGVLGFWLGHKLMKLPGAVPGEASEQTRA